jgi:hypothetical protein
VPSVGFHDQHSRHLDDARHDARADNYVHKVIDGEEGAAFNCLVATQDAGWVFEGEMHLGGRGFRVAGGVLSADLEGTATVTVIDSRRLSGPLTSTEPCTVSAAKEARNTFQVKPGSMWGQFTCAAVAAPPSTSCATQGYLVLENCEQN